MGTVLVASSNPVKIAAAQSGFSAAFPDMAWQVHGIAVPSHVSDQPMGDAETRQGAQNRANGARLKQPDATFTVGIEGGCTEHADGTMSCFAWIVVMDAAGKAGYGKTGTFYLPAEVAVLVASGIELGVADDRVFGRNNSKQQNGSVGLLTHDLIDRHTYYAHAVILALIPFMNPALRF